MCTDIHPRHAALVEMIEDYIAAKPGRSARGIGLRAARDPRMVPNLKRGQTYPAAAMIKLLNMLIPFLAEGARQEQVLLDELSEQLGRSGGHQLRAFPLAA